MDNKTRLTRRSFVKSLGAAGFAGTLMPGGSFAASPNGKLNIALVGAGGRGSYISLEALRLGENLVALSSRP